MDRHASISERQKPSITKRICLFFANGFREEILLLFKNSIPLVICSENIKKNINIY